MKLTIQLSEPVQGFFGTKGVSSSATIDGYKFADRLLEGVLFRADIISSKSMDITLNDPNDEDYMSDLNAFKFFKIAGQLFIESGGRNSSTRCLGLYDGVGGDEFLIGLEKDQSDKKYHFDCDDYLLKNSGYRSYDGKIVDFSWEE